MKFLEMLNDEQRNAVINCDGKNLIIAGAGSGKTTCLVARIKYLISKGIKPENILSITFTNKAAKELIDRINADNIDTTNMWAGTFHSIALRILRESLNGYKDITIYDEEDSRKVAELILKDMKEYGYNIDEKKCTMFMNNISYLKSRMISVEDYISQQNCDKEVAVFYEMYEKHLKNNNAIDFDSMIYRATLLLQNNRDIRNKYSEKFMYINVDEGQDTDLSQMRFIDLLASIHNNITIYGDDYQSIYSFRNADIDEFFNYVANYNKYYITTNYRSTQQIIDASNELIKKNSKQLFKVCKSNGKIGNKPVHIKTRNDISEAIFIANNIQYLYDEKGIPYSNMAVLYRTNAYCLQLEQELRKKGIPYVVSQNISFFRRKEIKDLLAYLKYIVNPNDSISFSRIFMLQSGIGEKTVEKILKESINNEMPIENFKGTKIKGVSTKAQESFDNLITFIASTRSILLQEDNHLNICKMLNHIYKYSGYEEFLNKNCEHDRIRNIDMLFEMAQSYELLGYDIYTFLQTVSLSSDEEENQNENAVKLMTVHASKGLEFDAVFVAGAIEGLFPHKNSMQDKKLLEEERRLFYVALTRAKQYLFITSPKALVNKYEKNMKVSTFVHNISEDKIRKYDYTVKKE